MTSRRRRFPFTCRRCRQPYLMTMHERCLLQPQVDAHAEAGGAGPGGCPRCRRDMLLERCRRPQAAAGRIRAPRFKRGQRRELLTPSQHPMLLNRN